MHFCQGSGHTDAVAPSNKEALGLLKTGPPPDLILLDLMTPVMNGREFRELQRQDARLASIPVVILSAVGEAVERQNLLGEVGYLQKPTDPDELDGLFCRFTVSRRPVILVVRRARVVRILDTVLRHYGFAVRSTAGGAEGIGIFAAPPGPGVS